MKLIQRAKFAAGPIRHYEPTEAEGFSAVRTNDVIQPAVVQLDGINLNSAMPKSAAEAARINSIIEQHVAVGA